MPTEYKFKRGTFLAQSKSQAQMFEAIGGKKVDEKFLIHSTKPIQFKIEESRLNEFFDYGFELGGIPVEESKKKKDEVK